MSWFRRAEEEEEPGPFKPETADHEAFRTDVLASIGRLLPGAVDEATPHVLDRLIDRHTAVQLARLMKQWLSYQDELMPYLNEARAEMAYEAVIYEAEQRNLAELRAAREAAVAWLHGTEQPPPELRNRGDSVNHRESDNPPRSHNHRAAAPEPED